MYLDDEIAEAGVNYEVAQTQHEFIHSMAAAVEQVSVFDIGIVDEGDPLTSKLVAQRT